jgi:integrase
MTGGAKPLKRPRGTIEELPSGSLRVRVYAGLDPVTKRRFYPEEVIPPGPKQAREAERAGTRLLNQVE